MLINIKKQTQPDVLNNNITMYSKKEYDKMINSEYLQELLKTGNLKVTTYALDGDYKNHTNVNPEQVIGTVKEIYDDYIVADINDECIYLNMIKYGELVVGMRYIANTNKLSNGITQVSDIKLICFDLIESNNNYEYYEPNTINKSFYDICKKTNNNNILKIFNLDLLNDNYLNYDYNIKALYDECVKNPWYFFRNLFKIPNIGDGCINYPLNIGNYYVIDAFINNKNLINYKARHNLSTITLVGIYIYAKYFTDSIVTIKSRNKKYFNDKVTICEALLPKALLEYAKSKQKRVKDPTNVVIWDEYDFIINNKNLPEINKNTTNIGCSVINQYLSKEMVDFIGYEDEHQNKSSWIKNGIHYELTKYTELMSEYKFKEMCKMLNNNESIIINSEIKLIRD